MPALSVSHGSATRAIWQEQPPILHRCRAWREGRMSDHRDWRAELERARLAGRLFDDVWYSAVGIEPTLRDEASA